MQASHGARCGSICNAVERRNERRYRAFNRDGGMEVTSETKGRLPKAEETGRDPANHDKLGSRRHDH